MKLSAFLVINAIVATVFGVAFVVVPGQVTSLYGVAESAPLEYTAQLFGAAVLAFGILTWFARNRRGVPIGTVGFDAVRP